jgi:DNA-binding FadR family transcriptional regulator
MARKHRDVMQVLVAEIVDGSRAEGSMLPKEVDLAERFDVSRGVARETIRALEERGLISVRHGRGATVSASDEWDVFDPDVLAATLESERGREVLRQYLECRRILEVEAAGIAALRAKKKDVTALRAAFGRMEECVVGPQSRAAEERFHEADVQFHQALIRATGNQALGGLVARIHSALVLARFPLARPEYRQQRALPEHRRILDAVAAGDEPEARQAMSDHLDTIAGYLAEMYSGRRRARRRSAA